MRARYLSARSWFLAAAALVPAGCDSGGASGCETQPGFICAVAGSTKAGLGAENEPAVQSELFQPQDVAIDPAGRVVVVDSNNHRVRAVDERGFIQTIAGAGRIGDALDGPPLQVQLNRPTHAAFDGEGRLLLSAWQNHKVMRLDADGVLRKIAGTGKKSFSGDEGLAAQAGFDLPVNTAIASDGSVFVADQGNQRVRKIGADGVVRTVLGSGEAGYGGDGGPALQAQIQGPAGQTAQPSLKIALDAEGLLYIADSGNHRVRKVDALGVITTIAGTGEAGFDGDGGPATQAKLSRPTDLAFDAAGRLYIADTDNSCIRRVDTDGTISTVAGRCGEAGFDGNDRPATADRLNRPFGIEVDSSGRLYIADTFNHAVRVVVP